MKRRQFEEILDECISAYLSGRRSVEHSLSLYPSIARELEPLLRAAADTADTLQQFHPPPQVQERIRQRILQAAAERAAARALTREIHGFEPRRHHSGYWVAAFATVAVATGAIVVLGLSLLRDSSSGSTRDPVGVSVIEHPEFVSNLDEARRQLDALQLKAARGEQVTSADLEALVGATLRLAGTAQPAQLAASEQLKVEEMIEEQLGLLEELGDDARESDDIEDAVAATVTAAAALGVPVPVITPDTGETPTASPRATATPDATTDATPSPSPLPSSGAPPD